MNEFEQAVEAEVQRRLEASDLARSYRHVATTARAGVLNSRTAFAVELLDERAQFWLMAYRTTATQLADLADNFANYLEAQNGRCSSPRHDHHRHQDGEG